ncbi:Cytolysin/lectin [Fomitopsis serialis]|uniref:Cytolysin/lectin n=1 Tax=Fomitopsis serialis TaxID=139415 RepID=UPI00200833BF|nr:Cytolysin/lectin [Neoantrodia serialis]KAH9916674.1 Cytolysin/lectin [Neoantrodia serialis]
MAYNIHVVILNTHRNALFEVVEQVVWYNANGGIWTNTSDTRTLTINGSGTSGALRFRNPKDGEEFFVPLGIDSDVRWCDLVTNLGPGDTAMKIEPEYYDSSGIYVNARESHLPKVTKRSSKGTEVNVVYTDEDPAKKEYQVSITISG